jgi:hypothetical protein
VCVCVYCHQNLLLIHLVYKHLPSSHHPTATAAHAPTPRPTTPLTTFIQQWTAISLELRSALRPLPHDLTVASVPPSSQVSEVGDGKEEWVGPLSCYVQWLTILDTLFPPEATAAGPLITPRDVRRCYTHTHTRTLTHAHTHTTLMHCSCRIHNIFLLHYRIGGSHSVRIHHAQIHT